jgi:hypothetical protein
MENIENKKICRLCGSTENKFQPKRHQCIKCRSKGNNVKLNEKKYYKTYYQEHKEEILLKQKENYHNKINNILI